MLSKETFKSLPRANKNFIALNGKKGDTMLYSITPEGRIKLRRDLSKWRSKVIGKRHAVYFSEAQSTQEAEHNQKMQNLISKAVFEISLDKEIESISRERRRQAIREALA